MKSAKHVIAPALGHIFNCIFCRGIYLDDLEIAKVIPIFKKGDDGTPENYRPISLLPEINRLLERVIEKLIRHFLNSSNCLSGNQFGLREGHSTKFALLDTENSIGSQLENGKTVPGLYLDLKKAFDSVDHSILLDKLLHYSIHGGTLSIISSNLKTIQQCVYINKTFSSYSEVSTGVP